MCLFVGYNILTSIQPNHYNETLLLFQHPRHYMSFTTTNGKLVKWLYSTFTHGMSELTLWWHGSEVGYKFALDCTWEGDWECLIKCAWLWIVKWLILVSQFIMSYVFEFSLNTKKILIFIWIYNELCKLIHNMTFSNTQHNLI